MPAIKVRHGSSLVSPTAVWLVVLAVWMVALVRAGRAQDKPPEKPADAVRTTLSGVYTAAQADRGQPTFEATCLGGCHNAASHRGIAFRAKWATKPLWDLYDLINVTMPDDDPGSLSASQSADVVAYVLKYNGLPAGKDELPTDPDALKKIKIEFPAEKQTVRRPGLQARHARADLKVRPKF